MATAEEYRTFARECISWADRAQTVERREILLDMAVCWAEAAARLDQQQALLGQLDEIESTKRRLSGCHRASAIGVHGRNQAKGSALPKHANGANLVEHERQTASRGRRDLL
jgi:hypothetical protein